MLFKKYDEDIILHSRKEVDELLNFILDKTINEDGPQGFFTINDGEIIEKHTKINGVVNSYAPAVKIDISECGNNFILKLNCSAVLTVEIVLLCFISFLGLIALFLLFSHNFGSAIIIDLFMMFIILAVSELMYNFFLKKCLNKINNKADEITKRSI